MSEPQPALKKTLGPWMLWGLGVGYVISGEYFGWNLGLPAGGTYGMLGATLLVTLMYIAFILSYTELACALPRAGGAFVYCTRAFGPLAGFLGGLVQIIEFVFAPPAIAMAIGAYVGQKVDLAPEWIALAAYLIFTALNAAGVRAAATFELFVTVLAVGELLLFIGLVLPAFDLAAFRSEPLPNGWGGILKALPYAIWFYLAIEGVANAAEEARDPQRSVAIGFSAALITLVVLALGVFFAAVGVGGWRAVVFAAGSTTPSDAPLPLALAQVVHPSSIWYGALLTVGCAGLVASFHGILLAAARATMEFGRSGLGPRVLGKVHARAQTPVPALIANLVLGLLAIATGRTGEIIVLSCLGALALYILSMAALFQLRKREPSLPRPFRAVAYPWFPAFALGSAALAFVFVAYENPRPAIAFAVMLALGLSYFALFARRRLDPAWLQGQAPAELVRSEPRGP